MTVRTAELLMALLMTVFSVYLMYKSAELPIGWIEDEGPGGGFWPFWLAAVMLLSCGGILFNWVRKSTDIAASLETYIEKGVLWDVGLVAGSLIITVFLFHWIGVYFALPLFLLMRNVGLIDTVHGLAFVYMALNIPFTAWLMDGFFRRIPRRRRS